MACVKSIRTQVSRDHIVLLLTNPGRQMSAFIYLAKMLDEPNLVWCADQLLLQYDCCVVRIRQAGIWGRQFFHN